MIHTVKRLVVQASCVTLVAVASIVMSTPTYAANANNYNAGNIIDDSVFTNSSSMSVAKIQQFLDSKVTCDTYGKKRSELGGGTRAQWLASNGISTPITCLDGYYENPSNGKNNYGKSTRPAGSISAAQIIYNYSKQFDINPQVIIVTLQKENGLVTDEWPTPRQYTQAMGYGCPDNLPEGAPACDPQYGSFSNQVYEAARHFRGYFDNKAGWWITFTTGKNRIAWSPNAACGTGEVDIKNRATVALYTYTPYQPNKAAKNAQYGTGDGCSAYGNRNFYLYFTDWFGSVRDSLSSSGLTIEKDPNGQLFTGNKLDLSFSVKNTTSSSYRFKHIGVAVRDPNGKNLDPGWRNDVLIKPGETYRYNASVTPTVEGEYIIYISSYGEQDSAWRECYIDNSQNACKNPYVIQKPVEITGTPTFTRVKTGGLISELRENQRFSVGYTIKNTSTKYSVKPGRIGLGVRTESGSNKDLSVKESGTLQPGSTSTYNAEGVYEGEKGNYRFFTMATKNAGKTWESQLFKEASSTVKQEVSVPLKEGVVLSKGVDTEKDGVLGSLQAIEFTITNHGDKPVDLGRVGVTVRGPQGQNLDPKWERVSSIEDKHVYRASFTPTAVGRWEIGYNSANVSMSKWNSGQPISDSKSVTRKTTVNVKDVASLTEGPTVTNGKSYVGKPVEVSFKIGINGDQPVDLGRVGVTVRGPQGQNLDPKWERVSEASGEYVYTASFAPSAAGSWNIGYNSADASLSKWDNSWPKSANNGVIRSASVKVAPSATITTGINPTSATSIGNRQVSFTVTNHSNQSVDLGRVGLAIRSPKGQNRDQKWERFNIAPNSTKTYSVNVPFSERGDWTVYITSEKNGTWNSNLPASDTSSIVRRATITVR